MLVDGHRIMATDVAREADNIIECKEPRICASSRTFTREITPEDQTPRMSSSSNYLMAEDRSLFSRDIDHWMNGSQVTTSNTPTEIGVQERVPVAQHSTLARSSSLEPSGLWYMLAMALPLFSMQNCSYWRCTPSLVINTAELLMTHFSRVWCRAREHIRQLSHDQVARELFATAMDIVLVIYAVGFLILSMYQASIFV